MRNSRKANLAIFAAILTLASCASEPGLTKIGQDPDIVLSPTQYRDTLKEASKLWIKRYNFQDLTDFTQVNEHIVRSERANVNDFLMQARAYFLLCEYFANDKFQIEKYAVKATHWSMQALLRNPEFKKRVTPDPTHPELYINALTMNDAEALYWLSASLAKYASDEELKTKIRTLMDRVGVLNANVNFGGVNRFYGVYFSTRDDATQTDLRMSRDQFERALKRFPDFFENHISFARFYAKKVGDEALLKLHVQTVLNSDLKRLKDYYPEQVLERARAKNLWSEGNYE